jgi:PAS domain S-box-containing protein
LILERQGYDVAVAETVREALERAKNGPFNVGLLDIRLPDGKGVELLRPLKERYPDIGLIMVTGYASTRTAIRALNDGATAYITKPFDMDEVLAEVRKVLKSQHLVAEKRRAEQALQESEQRYRSLFERVPVGLYRTAPDGRILDLNPALVEMLGFPDREAALRVDVTSGYVNPGDRARWQALMDRDGVVRDFVAQWRRHDGTAIWVEESARAVVDDEGRLLCYEGAVEDVTERKEMEDQLRRQERMAAVGQLAGGIAHDFNNFLSTIILYGNIILRHKLPPSLVSAAETIVSESTRASDLVRQILDFSRRSAMEVQSVDLVAFLAEVCDILQTTLPESIRLITEMEPQACPVEADPTRIQQVVMNLAINARDAMPEGGTLRVGLSRVTIGPGAGSPVLGMAPGEWVHLVVSDTGTGMTEEVKAQIFEPFFTTKERGQGTGLGMAQVYGIVKQHGGHIGVETELGAGTDVHVYLPADGAGQAEEAGEAAAVPKGRGETVLLVEDHENLREAGRQMLEGLGYRALTAAHGREALDMLEGLAVDVVVTDVVMPEMGGKALRRALGKMRPDLPVLAVTGYTADEALKGLEGVGFSDVLRKPLDAGQMARAIRRALDAPRS